MPHKSCHLNAQQILGRADLSQGSLIWPQAGTSTTVPVSLHLQNNNNKKNALSGPQEMGAGLDLRNLLGPHIVWYLEGRTLSESWSVSVMLCWV